MGITKLLTKLTIHVSDSSKATEKSVNLQERISSHERWESITRTHDSTILQISSNYRIMWSSLSYRLTKQHHRLSEDGSHRLTVGQALFQLGSSLMKRLDTFTAHSTAEEGESSSSSSEVVAFVEAESDYTGLIREVIDGSIVCLWPESTSLTLPFFLAEKGYAEALSVCVFHSNNF